MMRKALTVPPTPTPLPAAATGALTERMPTVRELEGRLDTPADDTARPTPALARRVAKLATDEPEQVARIMRGWLAEEER
jgi:flagellar biosynthesis/type III secretory pathway M-ring protein FliF/YscJ